MEEMDHAAAIARREAEAVLPPVVADDIVA